MLSIKNYRVYSLTTPENIIEKIKEIKPEIILLDLIMPYTSGIDACKIIRKEYSCHELPILILTAWNQSSNMKECFKAGCNDYLIKPIKKDELEIRISSQLDLKRNYLLEKEYESILTFLENIQIGSLKTETTEKIDSISKFLSVADENNISNKILNKLNKVIKSIINTAETNRINWIKDFESQIEKYDLTPRETELMPLILQGYINEDIAKKLNVTENTVKKHIYNIFNKVGVDNRIQLFSLLLSPEFLQKIFI